jgi:cytidylate kinase
MEGRDIGSFVLPDAQFKFFCTADENVRAKRRYEQQRAMGNEVKFEDVLKELQERDFKDVHRDHGALKILEDSIIVDTTKSSLEQSVKFCLKHIKKKYPNI